MTVKQIGSAPSNTLANVGLYVDGVLTGTATINTSNQYVFSISSPVTLSTGSHLIEVHGDVVAGATRSFTMYLEQGSDIALKDSQLGIYISPTETTSSAVSNIVSGLITLGGVVSGSANVIVNQDPAFSNTTTLVGGSTNTTLASFKFTAYGENTNVTSLSFMPLITLGSDGPDALNTLANVGLYVNGGQIGSNQAAKSGTTLTFSSLGSQLQIPVGTTVTVSIKGDVVADSTNTDTAGASKNYSSGTIEFDVASGAAQGVSSGSTSTTGFSQSGPALSVSTSNVTLASAASFNGSTVTPNSTVQLGAWTLQTGSAEGINVNTVIVTFPTTATNGNTAVVNSDLTNVVLKVNGTAVGQPIGNPIVGNNNFSVTIPVAINSSTELELYGTVGGSTSTYYIKPYIDIMYMGNTSMSSSDYEVVNSLTSAPSGVAGVLTTSGSVTIANTGVTTSTALTPQYVTGNGQTSSSLGIATFNVVANANVGGAVIQDMTFSIAGVNTIQSVTVNGITRSLSSTDTTVTVPSVNIAVPSNASGVNIPVTVQLVCIGSGCSGTSNASIQLNLTKLTYNNGSSIACVGASCTTPTSALSSASGNPTSYLVSTVPTVSMTTTNTPGSLTIGNQQIGTFTVSAGSTGSIKINTIPFTVAVSGSGTSLDFGTITLDDSQGNTLSNNTCTVSGSATAGLFTCSTPFVVLPNAPQTFTVYATTNGSLVSAAGSSEVFTLGNKANFGFTDVTGGSGTLPGTYIYGYPTGTQSKTN